MPGNGFGDSIHNFLGQESLSLGQHHSELVDSTWHGLSNNHFVGSQIHPVSNVKNFSVNQFAEFDRGHSGQNSSLQHGLNFAQSGMRPEIARNQSQDQSSIANGYMQGHRAFGARLNEMNLLGVAVSRGLSVLDSPMKYGPDLHEKNSFRLEYTESPINYNFHGGQHQVNGQHPGMIQPLPEQQSGMTDMQLLQQQSILKNIQEFQRQQLPNPQFPLPEVRQLSSVNQVSSFVKQGSDNFPPAPINGVPVLDASNYSWQPEIMTQMQIGCNMMPFLPCQNALVDLCLPLSKGRRVCGAWGNPYQHLYVQIDKPLSQLMPASSNSFPGSQFAMFPDQFGLQDGALVSRQGDQFKNVFGDAALQGSNIVFNSENLQQMTIQLKDIGMVSHGRQEHLRQSETSLEKSEIQALHSQNVASLDPTEEKILFGSDDSAWDIFGKNTNMGAVLDGTDSFVEFPSLQSGSWSALMQSAVAETSSNDIGVQEEWSGLAVHSSEPPSGNMPPSIANDGRKRQLPGIDNNLQNAVTLNSKLLGHSALQKPVAESAHSPDVQATAKSVSGHQTMSIFNASVQPYTKANGGNFIESASRSGGAISKSQDIKSSSQPSHRDHKGVMSEKRGHGSGLDLSVQENIEPWNVITGLGSPQVNIEGSDLGNVAALTDTRMIRVNKESCQQLPNGHSLNLWKNIDSKVNFGLTRGSSQYQQNLDKSPQSFDSSRNNCLDKGLYKANMEENITVKDTSNDSFHSNISHHTSMVALWTMAG
ncbi:uncharacterized protein LOC120122268 [Hibiscus syriacus]|uniref:uncharacterized protein LOC120122268 n=1 Tax=Hibiscus syriacus TaxID=106335 RepID=UPI0019237AED|nr:uncharacterized protein LOC120122268 [Hibiscus syriacus]